MSRRLALALAFLFSTFALGVIVSGGVVATLAGVRVSVRSPGPAAAAAAVAFVIWLADAWRRRAVGDDLRSAEAWLERHAMALSVAIALVAGTCATIFNAFSATGSDASGYLSYADLLAQGRLLREEPLAAVQRWRDAAATLAPLGWRAALEPGWQAPTYAIGLPLMLAPLHALGGVGAASLVIPAALATAVVAVAAVAQRLGGGIAALIAATWLATSPVAFVESMQIMSDVPVTAAWLISWSLLLRGQHFAGGCATACAVLIRPNLAPLAIVPAIASVLMSRGSTAWGTSDSASVIPRMPSGTTGAPSSRTRNHSSPVATLSGTTSWPGAALRFAVPVAIAGLIVAALQTYYFGSPLRSGYGTADEIYSLTNVPPNARLYLAWLLETHGPWLVLAPLAILVARQFAWLAAFALLVVAAYLVYAVFESWTYLRFMLPALAIAMIGVALLAAALLRRTPSVIRVPVAAVLVLTLAAANISAARAHGVFRLAQRQARGDDIGRHLASALPVNAVIISGEHSGTIRYYTDRSVVRWDLIEGNGMTQALDWLRLNGYQMWVVLDDWEEEPFRRKFPTLAALSIDERPAIESTAGAGIKARAWRVRRAP